MELTFLGTGAAFAGDAFNAAYILDRRILLDAGAPIHVLIKKTGHDIGLIEAAIISHQHADHTFGLPFFLATRVIEAPDAGPFTIVGPPGFEAYAQSLLLLAWGQRLYDIVMGRMEPKFVEVISGDDIEVAGFRLHAEKVEHVLDIPCLGYHLSRDGVSFGYSGDTGPCSGLEALVELSDDFLIEMTAADMEAGHMSRGDVEALVGGNPGKRFYLTHLNRHSVDGSISGATTGQDLETVHLGGAEVPFD
jgi:ribonuclease BN (tRNA processing enzyme)